MIYPAFQCLYRENYVFLQVGFQHLAYEKREDIQSYGAERLFGKSEPCSVKAFNQQYLLV